MNNHFRFSAFSTIVMLVCFSSGKAPAQWYSQSPSPTGNSLNAVSFTDANNGSAVGSSGAIVRTTDGGSTWSDQSQTAQFPDNLFGVFFTDANNGTAVGSDYDLASGVIVRTTDGGNNWVQQTSGTTNQLNGVYFTSPNSGVVVGQAGIILRTTDGGNTWGSQTSGTTNNLNGVHFIDANTGTIVGQAGTILRTTDGGVTWTPQTSGVTVALRAVYFTDTNTGTVVGASGNIRRTTDGGTTWTGQASGVTVLLRAVFFTDTNIGTVVGASGNIRRTTDGGATWTFQPSGTANQLNGVFFTSGDTGVAVGNLGTILGTTDGGTTWFSQSRGVSGILRSVSFINADVGTVAGASGTIARTTDGGFTWTAQTSGTTMYLTSVHFVDANNGWAVGGNLAGSGGTVLRTTDGGSNWSPQTPPTTAQLNGVFFTDANTGTAVGHTGTIIRTTDGGATWATQTSGTTSPLLAVFFTDADTGTAVGFIGLIRRTTDGGATWTTQTGAGANTLNAVFFTDANTGTAVGATGVIRRTTDGGTTWTAQTSGTTNQLNGISFTDANTGIVVGASGTIRKTTDGGATWSPQTSGTTSSLWGVSFTDANNGTAVGDNGAILRTSTPSAPLLASPPNGATGISTSPTLSWNPSARADSYRLHVSTDSAFASSVVDESGIIGTSFAVSALDNNTLYYWRVNASNAGGTSTNSEVWNLTTIIAAPAIPVPLSPPNGSTGQSLTLDLQWESAARAETYHLQVATDSLFANLLVDDSTLVDTTHSVSGLLSLTTYYWRVQAINAGGTSGFSQIWSFRTIGEPSQVALISPPHNAINQPTAIVFFWGTPPDTTVDRYWFEMVTDTSTMANLLRDTTLTDTTETVGSLANLTAYFWRVRAHNEAGWGVFGTWWKFTTIIAAPAMPGLLSPANGSIGQLLDISLQWMSAARAEKYHLQVATDSLFTAFVIDDSTIVDTTHSPSGLLPLTTYYWRVQGRNVGGTSGFTRHWSFRTLGAPTQVALVSPPHNAVNQPTTVTFVWERAQDQTLPLPLTKPARLLSGGEGVIVSRYWFEMVTDTVTMANLLRDTTLTDTTKTVSSLTNLTAYYWRVRANNEIGWGVFSPWWKFTTIIAPPAQPVLVSPPHGSVNQPTTLTLRWRVAARAEIYHLKVALDSMFTTLVFNDSTLTDTLQQIGPLGNSTLYYWHVQAKNIGGISVLSATWNFRAVVSTAAQVQLISPANGATVGDSVVFVWQQSQPEVDRYWFEYALDSSFTFSAIDSNLTDTTRLRVFSTNEQYWWRVRAHNAAGWGEFSNTHTFTVVIVGVDDVPEIPKVYTLEQNYPNPFNPTTQIRYALPKESLVTLRVYNMLGQEIATLVSQEQNAGYITVTWDGRNAHGHLVGSGLYFCRLEARPLDDGEVFVRVRKMLMLR